MQTGMWTARGSPGDSRLAPVPPAPRDPARKSLILTHGEMSEWLKEHACKAKRTSDTKLRGPARRRPHGRPGPIVLFRTPVPLRGAGLTALSTAFAGRRATRRALPERAAD